MHLSRRVTSRHGSRNAHRRRAPLLALVVLAGGLIAPLTACGDDARPGAPARIASRPAPCPTIPMTFSAEYPPPGCWRPYSARSPFNRVVPSRPRLLDGSARIIRQLTDWGPPQRLLAGHADTSRDYFHPLYWSRPGDPVFRVHCVKFGRCPIEGHRIRIPAAARAAGGGDGHLAVIDRQTGWEYDFWQVRRKPARGGRLDVSYGGRTRIRGTGLGSNATAAWFGLAAGVIRVSEMRAGQISHALFAQVKCTSGRSVYPAHRGTTAAPCGQFGISPASAPPLGSRIWLDLPPARIEALKVPGWRKTILRALHRYGMIVGDTNGGNGAWGLQGESGSSFTSFGKPDPWETFAASVTRPSDGAYALDIDGGVDWSRHLKVLDPCVSRGRC